MLQILNYLPPAIIMFIGAAILAFIKEKNNLRAFIIILTALLALIQVFNISDTENNYIFTVASLDINLLYNHPYSKIFAVIFCIAALIGGIYALYQSKSFELVAAYIYAGGALGVVFSGDFIGLFFYWEIMAFASTAVILAAGNKAAFKAALRYLYIHLFGGVLLMVGIIAYINYFDVYDIASFANNIDINLITGDNIFEFPNIAILFILAGILVNCAAPPLSNWLTDAYPKASAFGSVFLSSFTTKTAIFLLLTLFAGAKILIYIGVFMLIYGIIMGILENNMRRILSYSIISKVGFMLIGIGVGTQLAQNGVALQAFGHIIYKALLFMSAGAVLYRTGENKVSELGGLYRTMKYTAIFAVIASLALVAIPFSSAFVSKSLITTAVAKQDLTIIWLLLLAAAAGAVLHVGFKFTWLVFFGKDSGLRPKEAPKNMLIAMLIAAILCIIPGIPGITEITLYKLLPVTEIYQAHTPDKILSQIQILLFSVLAAAFMLPFLKPTRTINLDFDWIYRKAGLKLIKIFAYIYGYYSLLVNIFISYLHRLNNYIIFTMSSPSGIAHRPRTIGATVGSILMLLVIYLIMI